jgi:hypothetical protein
MEKEQFVALKISIKLEDYSSASTLTWVVLTVKANSVRLWKLGENQARRRKPENRFSKIETNPAKLKN